MIKNMISKKSDETDERKKSRTVCSALFNGACNGKGVVMEADNGFSHKM